MPKKSQKGGAFERLICTTLSKWWTNGENEDVLWRSAGSGARATIRGRKGKRTSGHYGDVCATDPIARPLTDLFVIELKRGYNRFTVADILDRSEHSAVPLYQQWFEKAEKTQKAAGTWSWMLIVKRDTREPLVFLCYSHLMQLLDGIYDFYPSLELCYGTKRVMGVVLSQFLQLVDPKTLCDIHDSWRKDR